MKITILRLTHLYWMYKLKKIENKKIKIIYNAIKFDWLESTLTDYISDFKLELIK